MSCEGNFRAYCEWLVGQAESKLPAMFGDTQTGLRALDRIFQAARRQPLPAGAQRTLAIHLAEAATRSLFLRIRRAGFEPPTHAASGLPKRNAQLGYAAVWLTLQAIETDQPLPPLAEDVRRQLVGQMKQVQEHADVFQSAEAATLQAALLTGLTAHTFADGGVLVDSKAQGIVEMAVSTALATQIQEAMPSWRRALKQFLDDPYVLPVVMTQPWRTESAPVQLQRTIQALLRRWAAELTERDALTTVLQQVVMDRFAVSDGAALPTDDVFKARKVQTLQVHRPFLTAVVEAQYTLTQRWLKEQGMTHVSVWRGMRVESTQAARLRDDDLHLATITMRPVTSTTTVRTIAEHFATKRSDGVGVLGAVRVPAAQVIATCRTGIGTISELEVMILGGSYQMLAQRVPDKPT